MIVMPPTNLTTEELIRYAQLEVDKNIPLPDAWAQELINRLVKEVDEIASKY